MSLQSRWTIRIASAALATAALVLVSTSPATAQEAAPKPKSKVLFVTQSKGFRHGSVTRKARELSPAEIAMTQLGQQTGLFEVHCTQDAEADFTKQNLAKYDIVMFYTTGTLPISDEARDYFKDEWLKQKGHGFIGFHSATDTYRNDPANSWYWEISGGTFNSHPWTAGTTVTIRVHDPDHPTMRPFGEEFTIRDEIYQYDNWKPENVRVLMSLDMEKTNPRRPYHVPVAWCRSWGEGKIFMNNLGHNETTWTDKRFLDSVTAAVKWIRGEVEAASEPNPEVSKAWDERSKAAAR